MRNTAAVSHPSHLILCVWGGWFGIHHFDRTAVKARGLLDDALALQVSVPWYECMIASGERNASGE